MDVRLDSLSILGLKGHMWPMWSWECGLKKIIFTEDMVVKTHSWFNDEHRQSSCKVLRAETQHSQRKKRDLQQTTFVKSLRPSSGQRKPWGARSRIMGARPGWSLAWRLCIFFFFLSLWATYLTAFSKGGKGYAGSEPRSFHLSLRLSGFWACGEVDRLRG